MFQVKVNDQYSFEIEANEDELKVNEEIIGLDRVQLNSNSSHVLYKNKSYSIEIVSLDTDQKTAVIKVNGHNYMLSVKDRFDQLLRQLGLDNLAASKILKVKAPMPGLVLNVLVAEGEEVKKGDNLLVLEAMKMENMIKSPTDGKIKKVEVGRGDKVEKNELLISFD